MEEHQWSARGCQATVTELISQLIAFVKAFVKIFVKCAKKIEQEWETVCFERVQMASE